MNAEESQLSEQAFIWIKKNKKVVIEHFALEAEYVSDTQPVTLFMAGSPDSYNRGISFKTWKNNKEYDYIYGHYTESDAYFEMMKFIDSGKTLPTAVLS